MNLLVEFGLAAKVKIVPLQPGNYDEVATANIAYYEPARSATIMIGDSVLGEIGEYRSGVRKALKLPDFCAGFELDLAALLAHGLKSKQYVPLSRFPDVSQDICFKVASELTYEELRDFVASELESKKPDNGLLDLGALDIYQRDDDLDHKQITFRVSLTSYERTLTDKEVSGLLNDLAASVQQKFSAERI